MRKTIAKITRYDAGDGFYIDIEESLSRLEAWIWTKEYGVKYQMGYMVKSKDMGYNEFLQIVEANLQKHKDQYLEEVEYL